MFFQETMRREQAKKDKGDEITGCSDALLEEVNDILSQGFVKGPVYATFHTRIKDLVFLRSVNTLPKTPFIATTGPKNADDLCRFLTDILSCPPKLTIVALGDRLSDAECGKDMDFMDYYMRNYKVGPYHIEHKMRDGHFQSRNGISTPVIFAESDLTLLSPNESKKVHVVGLQLTDGQAIDLDDDPSSQKKEILWRLFYRSLEEHILVHCKHGHGRTGHLILTLQLLRHFDDVFCYDDPQKIADKVLDLLSAMREQRPNLVHTLNQLTQAVRNAVLLYRYALEQGYILNHEKQESPDESLTTGI